MSMRSAYTPASAHSSPAIHTIPRRPEAEKARRGFEFQDQYTASIWLNILWELGTSMPLVSKQLRIWQPARSPIGDFSIPVRVLFDWQAAEKYPEAFSAWKSEKKA